jgi:hypothetical protein
VTELEAANAALRDAVETRLAGRSAMAASLAGCQPALEAATAALLPVLPLTSASDFSATSEESSEVYSEWTPPEYARREEAVAGFRRVVEQARPAREAREGTTAKFGTGAIRSDTCEEFRYDLVSPIGLREVARACAEGAAKYSDYNWERGMPVHDLLNHAIAHVYQYLAGDRREPHLGHAAWNLLAAIHSEELWPHLNAGHLRGPGCTAPAES